uniref:Uncharacterized protein n=1 Tax=Chrysotila carterae TaxID=13221 RepID=A0A7S4B6P1_CHRCT
MARLRAGKPVTLGVLGASVAQNGGCLTQPGQRCMGYNGLGGPTNNGIPPPVGFAVRLHRTISQAFPRSEVRIENAAVDAMPAQSILECLFTRLPVAGLDMVILEFGSLALHTHPWATEVILRKLLSMPNPPLVVFLTIRGITHRGQLIPQARPTAWSRLEDFTEMQCAHYNVGCVSFYKGLAPLIFSNATGFAVEDVMADGLHPTKGRHGNEYFYDTLAFWFQETMARASISTSEESAIASLTRRQLPPPLLSATANALKRTAPCLCYGFGAMLHGKYAVGRGQRQRILDWRTAHDCAGTGGKVGGEASAMAQRRTAHETANACRWETAEPRCPAFGEKLLTWAYCSRAIVKMNAKSSRGVVATSANAVLETDVNTVTEGQPDPHAKLTASLTYLGSYEGMGRARVACVANCRCPEQLLDGRRISTVRNDSTWETLSFSIEGAHPKCVLRVTTIGPDPNVRDPKAGSKVKLHALRIAKLHGRHERSKRSNERSRSARG